MFDFPLCLAKVLCCFSNFDALLTLFQANTATRLFYGVRNFAKPYDFISIPTIEDQYVTGFDKSRLGRTHQANSFSTTNRQVHPWANN